MLGREESGGVRGGQKKLKMLILEFLFWATFSLGIVLFFKFFAYPYAVRQYGFWKTKRRLRRMAKRKPPEVQADLERAAEILSQIMREDKM